MADGEGVAPVDVTVIIMAVLSSLILFTFDLLWSGITERVYG